MKRHISIFTFLLGAFAAAFVPSVVQARTIWTWGYFMPNGNGYNVSESISANPGQAFAGNPVTLTADYAKMSDGGKGLTVDYWLEHENYVGNFGGTKINGSEGENPYVWTCTNPSGNSCFAVRCKYITYNLKYDANGGPSVSGGSHSYPDTYELAPAPIREGYRFESWKDGDGVPHAEKGTVSGVSFTELNAVHTDGATVTLKAMWTVKNYNVKSEGSNCTVYLVAASAAYDGNLTISWTPVGGSWKKPTVKVYGGTDDTGTLLATYTTGTSKTFNMSNIGKGYFENIFIKASYDIRTLFFDANEGSCDESSRRCEFQEPIGDLPEATRESYLFAGWWTEKAGGVQIMSRTDQGDQTYVWDDGAKLYAHWTLKNLFAIDVVSSPDGGGTVTASGEMAEGKFVENSTVTLTATPATGYSFWHWMKGETEVSTDPQYQFTVKAPATFTGVFTGNVYTVTFYALDGVPMSQTKDVTFGSPYGTLPTATKEGDWELEGWYTAPMGGGVKIEPETTNNTVGAQMLFANWKAVPVYSVAYDGNGSTSVPMADQKMYCGVPANLSSNTYERGGWHFRGWATNETDAAALKIAYEDGELVTDIGPTNGTVTLYAAWESISLAEAMHCDNLEWTNAKFGKQSHECKWSVDYGDGKGSNTLSCVTQDHSLKTRSVLTSGSITNSGTLSFYWRPLEQDGALAFWIDGKDDELSLSPGEMIKLDGKANVWSFFSTNLTTSAVSRYVHIEGYTGVDVAHSIDLMTWTPGGPEPEEKDAVTISSAAVSDGKFILSFDSDANFDYNLLTNANLLSKESWGVMTNEVGTGGSITFEPKIIEGQPQMFYRVDTIQRK